MADASHRTDDGRLDSWKAIAAYLKRDESTVRRWERELGLPVRRVSGSRGSPVFAYASELDTWLRTQSSVPESGAARRLSPRQVSAVVAVVAIAGLAGVGWWAASSLAGDPVALQTAADGIVAFDASGREVWRVSAAANERMLFDFNARADPAEFLPDSAGVLVATGVRVHTPTNEHLSGQLTHYSNDGLRRQVFEFDDAVRFGSATYAAPWAVIDYRVEGQRVALAAHHDTWWPGLITVLDGEWNRVGTFVNAGWTDRVHWLTDDRLVIAGFSQSQDGGMVALLDLASLNGQSPEDPASPFYCSTCGEGRPVRYVVMPRTEINRVTGSRFNRAKLELNGDRLLVKTIEMAAADGSGVDALYEFSPDLELLSASFSTRYWEVHRSLEAEGKLDHTREQCPDRDGPRLVIVWTPATGWTTPPVR